MFSKLSTELLCLTLAQLDSLQDLYSAIRASTFICNAFRGARCAVLSAIIGNILGPGVMPDALLTLRACQPAPHVQDLRLSLAEAEKFCYLWHSHEYFIKSLLRDFKTNLNAQMRAKHQGAVNATDIDLSEKSLSPLEIARIQRAMLRYSAFQSMINDPRGEGRRSTGANRIAFSFGHYTPWEIEEVVCVHQHILYRLEDVIKRVEDHFVDSVRATEQNFTSRYIPRGLGGLLDLQSEDAELLFITHGDYVFTKGHRFDCLNMLQYLSSLGLPFLQSLFEASPDLQRQIISEREDDYLHDIGLTTTLRQRPPSIGIFKGEYAGFLSKQRLEFEGDDLQKRNLAWLWAHHNRPEPSYYWRCNTDLRDWGYVFWDSDRLRRWGVLSEPRPNVFYNDLAPHYKAREPLRDRPSAQERLRELGLA